MRLDDRLLALLRDQVGGILLGAVFVALGLAACGIAAMRGRGGVRILVWFGIFDLLYGVRLFADSPAAFSLLPQSTWHARSNVVALITYFIVIPALLFSAELCGDPLRRWLNLAVFPTLFLALLGVSVTLLTGSIYRSMRVNSLLIVVVIASMVAINSIPALARKLRIDRSPASLAGTLVLAAGMSYSNLMYFFHRPFYSFVEPLSFFIFVCSLGYLAAEKIFANERRLLSMESELAIAREIQTSTLPGSVPGIDDLSISAAYYPMTAVAGDFYEFIPVDQRKVGFLVADVSGHGVPAALIAAMIKVAMHSLLALASQPAELLRGLNRILCGQLRGQFVTAAYLWVDTGARTLSYSAAGHPPLLRWSGGRLERIESNGLLIGVSGEADYPVRDLPLHSGDRFLLYTDGVTEPESATGEAFGERRLEETIASHEGSSPSELSDALLDGIRRWNPVSTGQEDDITLIVIDVA